MLIDDNLEMLAEGACRALLARGGLGRVGVTVGGLPVILPVTYAFADDHVVFRTGPGTKLRAATDGNIVAFETDEYDPETHDGWSVLVVGRASVLDADAKMADASFRGLKPFGTKGDDECVRIRCEVLTGRRIARVEGDASLRTTHADAGALPSSAPVACGSNCVR